MERSRLGVFPGDGRALRIEPESVAVNGGSLQ